METIDSKLDEVDALLDAYEQNLGLRMLDPPKEVDYYLQLTKDMLTGFSDQQCGIGAYILANFSHHLQKSYNRENSRLTWADANLKMMGTKLGQQFNVYSYEEKKLLGIQSDEAAMKLMKLRTMVQERIDRLSFLSQRVDFMAKTLSDLQYTKRQRKEAM